ncbi:unnamed protein product [Rotaria sordida]|uniref:Uncharacterized protein n=1 Tax=Rotaria sordida TaxID=392033 RepID=A0A818PWP4_9BILA|nr:unnamed protein product [Rotaria sordida]CAF3631946.1 unnamed protein product [Rotaria sordida]
MQTPLNTLDTQEPLDYDNLNIITRPRPPRRRQSGVSLVPFRPYVKCLQSVRQPYSFANGYDRWMVMGRNEIFFTQPNARCIGSLIEDCDVSDVIRWDIEGESTRLPMMCKLWMIVDGAVVERGKPHLVQDAAVQVSTSGRNLHAIISTQRRYNQTTTTTLDRRRRHSWHDVNEYHSVPYYQYTRAIRIGYQRGIQCDIDNEQLISKQEILSEVEETVDENLIKDFKKEIVQEKIHHPSIPQNHIHISITTQTESQFINRSTSIDSQFIHMFNLNLETNQLLLSSIANPYRRAISSNYSSEIISIYRNGIEYKHRSVSTGDDYPHWWLRLTTDFILSDFIKIQNEEKEKKPLLPPSPRYNQSVQTDIDESRTSSSSSRSQCIQKSSSSAATTTTTNHYELIDEINAKNCAKQCLPFSDISQRIDSHHNINCRLCNYQIKNSSIHDYANINKQSENDNNIFVSSLNHDHQKQSYSIPDHHQNNRVTCHCFSNDTTRTRTNSSESTSTTLLASLLERYERTLRERQRAIAIINDELLDIDDVLKYYREKIYNTSLKQSNRDMEHCRDISLLPKEDRSSAAIINIIKDKYRSMPGLTSEEMIKGYMPSPKVHINKCLLDLSKQRQPRFLTPSTILTRPDYCDLYLTGHRKNSSWIRYNEQKIEELQKRIDLMLQIDDIEEAQLLLSSTPIIPTTATVTQRIDDILLRRSKYPSLRLYDYHRFLSPHRYQYYLPHRLNQSLPNTSHPLNRCTKRSTTPISKSVRISTQPVPPHRSRSVSQPLVSILRHSSVPDMSRSTKLIESSHIWKSKSNDLKECDIPRYYRLYNDVSFREVYNFSRLLDTYLATNRISTKDYSSMIKKFALEQQLPSPITSVA